MSRYAKRNLCGTITISDLTLAGIIVNQDWESRFLGTVRDHNYCDFVDLRVVGIIVIFTNYYYVSESDMCLITTST